MKKVDLGPFQEIGIGNSDLDQTVWQACTRRNRAQERPSGCKSSSGVQPKEANMLVYLLCKLYFGLPYKAF